MAISDGLNPAKGEILHCESVSSLGVTENTASDFGS